MKTHLIFRPMEDKPKTKVFAIVGKSDFEQRLGVIKWYGPWRKYCFFPDEETVWDVNCMAEVMVFIENLMDERRKK